MSGPAGPLPRSPVCGKVDAVCHHCGLINSLVMEPLYSVPPDCTYCSYCLPFSNKDVFHSDILRIDSTNADALYVRGLCLYYEDCIDKAVQFFIQALRMAPDHAKARLACRV